VKKIPNRIASSLAGADKRGASSRHPASYLLHRAQALAHDRDMLDGEPWSESQSTARSACA
jgi:hypothetical protein